MKRRVLYCARAPFVSGAERALLSTLRGLDRDRIEPRVVVGADTDLIRLIRDLDIEVDLMPMPRRSRAGLWPWWRSTKALDRIVRGFKPDLLHANDVPSCQAMSVVGGQRHIPRVIHIRWQIDAAGMGWWAYRGTEAILCISQWIRSELGDVAGTAVAKADIRVAPDPVEWTAAASALDACEERPSDGPIRFGFAGQLIPAKGVDLVIEGVAMMPADQRPMVLIAGEDTQRGGAYKAELQQLAADRGVANHFQWLGFLNDVAELYRQVDAVICPSRLEPLGLVPLEAAAYRLPAMASKLGGFLETIADDKTGRLVDPSADAWARAITELGDRHTLRRMGEAARARVLEHYSMSLYQRRLMDLYESLWKDSS